MVIPDNSLTGKPPRFLGQNQALEGFDTGHRDLYRAAP
jgi:hypothetical protein